MKLSAFLGAILLAAAAHSQCQVRPRKEIRTLSDAEWNAFASAVKSLQSGSSPTAYDRFVKMHVDNTNTVHGGSNFFPWHRWYLREFEKALQAKDSSIMLPYWNWAYDSQAPEKSIVFETRRFGGNGRGNNRCVQDGSFAGWMPAYPNRHCLSRNFDNGARISSFYSVDVINSIISNTGSYDAFRRGIEMNPHGAVHVGIGGDMGEMISPNDPIFWLHHAFVDKIWWERQKTRPNDYDGSNPNGVRATTNDVLPSFPGVRVSSTFKVESLCYTYQDLTISVPKPTTPSPSPAPSPKQGSPSPAPAPAPSPGRGGHRWKFWRREKGRLARRDGEATVVDPGDREDLVNLRIPKSLPDQWCKMNNFSPKEAEEQKGSYAEVTKKINAIVGYIPVCSLWLREDFLEKIVQEEKKLVVKVKDKKIVTDIKEGLSPKDKVKELKDNVHQKYGGSLRSEAKEYKDKLKSIVGNIVATTKDAIN